MSAFHRTILCGHITTQFLQSREEARTILQYLIEIMCLVNDKALARLVFGQFAGVAGLKHQESSPPSRYTVSQDREPEDD